MVVAAGITAAAGAAGSLISATKKGASSSQQTTTTDASHTPIPSQGAAIDNALAGATSVYNDRTNDGPYTGALYSGTNDWQLGAMTQGAMFGSTTGLDAAKGTIAEGASTAGALGGAVSTANGVAQNGIGAANGALTGVLQNYATGASTPVDAGLSSSLNSAATAGANAIGGYNNGLSSVASPAMSDPTQQLANDAGTYMNSSPVQAMIANANNQIETTLNETTNPGLNRAAAMGGNINSSRAGMAEAMANRDAALAEGNADAQIDNNAFNTGLSTASAQRTAGLSTAAGANSAGLTGNSNLALGAGNQDIAAAQTQIGAATSGLSQDTARDTANASAKLGAASALTNAGTAGVSATSAGIAQGTAATNLFQQSGNEYQQNQNNENAAAYQQWLNGNQYQQGVLNDYMADATKPSGFYDASTASNVSSTPASSLPSLIAGAGTAIGSTLAPGGILSSTNKDGSTNQSYIGNWFSSGAGTFDGAGTTGGFS